MGVDKWDPTFTTTASRTGQVWRTFSTEVVLQEIHSLTSPETVISYTGGIIT